MRASKINDATSVVRRSAFRRGAAGVALTEEVPHECGMTNKRTAAFATVLSLLIVALLVVVLVGAAMLLRVETFTSSNAQKIAEARQNAIYGLEMALADLQELAGPDQRVTATAELSRNATDSLWTPDFLPGAGLTNKATTPSRNWTGVWDVSKNRTIPDATTPGRVVSNVGGATNQVSPKPLKWLVSGGQRKSGGAESQTNNITPAAYPARIAGNGSITGVTSSEDHILLLGSGSVDLSLSPEDGVVVPKVPVFNPASPVPANPSGSYAFWVGDEGVKAKFQAGAETKSFDDTFSGAERDILRLSAPQKLGIGAVSANGTTTLLDDGYDPSDSSCLAALRRLSTDTQIGYLPDGDKLGPDFKRRFHDLTLHSQGVLSDVKKGGLKQDLTVYLQQGNIAGKINDTDLLYEDSRDDSASVDPTNPRAPFRVRFPGFHPTSNNGLPRIGLLRSWYNLTTPAVRPQTETQHGMFPVITRCEWPAWLHMDLNLSGATYPFTIPSSAFELRIHPTITLYNPYNVDLPGETYTITMKIGNNAAFELRRDTNTSGQPIKFHLSAALGAENMVFTIPASESSLKSGESKIFTLKDSNVAYSASMEMVSDYATETPGFGSGLTYPVNPNGQNPNSYFKISGAYADAADPLKITAGSGALGFLYLLYRPNTPPNTALPRLTELSISGSVVQQVTDAPASNGWVTYGSAATTRLVFSSGFSYSGPNTRELDTRLPVASFNSRPLTHRASTTVDPAGGSLSAMMGYNLRPSTDDPAPAIWWGGFGESRYWGTKRNMPDGTTSMTIRGYSPPMFSGGSPAMERFAYTWQNSPSGPSQEVSVPFAPGDLGLSAPLFALRSSGSEVLGLSEFQHANLGVRSWQPSYVAGNSYVDAKLKGRDCYAGFFRYGDAGAGIEYFTRSGIGNPANSSADIENRIYDASFMANEALWDRFFLSGSETSSALTPDLLANKESLPNSRLRLRKSEGVDYNALGASGDKLERGAAFLLNDGAFNINSTSIEAWKAILSTRLGLRINSETANPSEAVFARMLNPGAGNGTFFDPPTNQPAAERYGAYTGARKLSANEIQVLAEEIVRQVKQRGPFTSVSDFVNRRLTTELAGPPFSETDVSRTGLVGLLQAAIDAASDRLRLAGTGGINSRFYNPGVRGSFFTPEKIQVFPGGAVGTIADVNVSDSNLWGAVVPRLAMLGRDWYYSAAGVPGFITQADILQAIGPLLAARSDTFRVRSYGEVKNPKTGKIESRAWCEAIVQRVPDPMKRAPTAEDVVWPERPGAAANPLNAAGRKFKVIAFRWLTPEEV